MRFAPLLLLLFAACARAPEETPAASRAQPLALMPKARLASVHQVATEGLSPTVSPDGQWVLFSGPRLQGLTLVAAAGGPARRITDEPGVGYKPAFSPDSKQIAYATREEDGSRQLRVIAREGGSPETVWKVGPGAAAPFPYFSPRGELLFVDGGERIRSRAAGKALTEAIPAPRFVVRAGPDGLLLGGDVGVYTTGPAGEKPRILLQGRQYFDPVVSPDGTLALVRELGEGGSDLWALESASGRSWRLGHFERGCVLPKSGLVIAELNEDDGLMITRSELWAMGTDGSNAIKLSVPEAAMPHRVSCAQQIDRIAFTDEASGSLWVADVEVAP
jgi:hypothetical protein